MTKLGFTVVAVLAGVVSMIAAVGASAAPRPSHVVGHVYVDDNTAGTNTVAGFYRHADGSLTPIPGSPFSAGGAGTGHANASQGSLEFSSDRRYLLAVDAGSNQISVLKIKHDGSLQVSQVVSSNGGNPVSIAVHGRLVFVANADPSNPNYTGFTFGHGGRLQPIPGSTISLPAGSQPGDVLFSGDGKKLVGARVGTSLIDSFIVHGDGRLVAAPGSPFVHQPGVFGQFGSEFNPRNSRQLFVSKRTRGGWRAGKRLGVHRRGRRDPQPDRGVPLRQRRDRLLLDRDQPRRQVPVHGQYRFLDRRQLLDRQRRVAHRDRQHSDQERQGRRGRTALA
jgi:hypothetical protein